MDTTCTYEKTIGTQYSEQMSEDFSISVTVKVEMKAEFWDIFSASLSVSSTTGYDWSQVSTETQSEQETFTVSATAPPGIRYIYLIFFIL